MKLVKAMVDPPTRLRILPNLGTVNDVMMIKMHINVLNRQRFQVNCAGMLRYDSMLKLTGLTTIRNAQKTWNAMRTSMISRQIDGDRFLSILSWQVDP